MATVTLTARHLHQLKSHGKRCEVFDAIVPGLAIRGEGPVGRCYR